LQYVHVSAHIEKQGLPENFLVSGTSTAPFIIGLEYEDQNDFASTSVIALDSASGVTSATIRDLSIRIGTFVANPSATVFDNAGAYTIYGGDISLPSPTNWTSPAGFAGRIFTGGVPASGPGSTFNYGGGANLANGQNSSVCGGTLNTASGLNSFSCGLANTADGSFDLALGDGAQTHGRMGVACHGSSNATLGQTQSCSAQMHASGTTPMQLTVDANAGNSANEFNINTNNTTFGFGLRVSCRDISAPGNDITAIWLDLMMSRDANAASTTLTAASRTTPDYSQPRGVAGFNWALAADTTNSGLSITAFPPNGDTWHCGAQILPSIEVQ
jgi:hypothetical protein